MVSAAAVVELSGGTITSARLARGGVAHRPRRLYAAEAALAGRTGVSLGEVDALRAAVAASHRCTAATRTSTRSSWHSGPLSGRYA